MSDESQDVPLETESVATEPVAITPEVVVSPASSNLSLKEMAELKPTREMVMAFASYEAVSAEVLKWIAEIEKIYNAE